MKNLKLFFVLILVLCTYFFSSDVLAKPIKATVMKVDEKHKFIVLDKGREEGLTNGMELKLYRNNEYVGDIEVIKAKKGVAAVDIRSLKDISVSARDELILKFGGTGTGVQASFEPYQESEKSHAPTVPSEGVEREVSKGTEKAQKESGTEKQKRGPEKETPLALKPFKKMKDATISAGREVKSWFTGKEKFGETKSLSVSDKESKEFEEAQISKVSAVKFVKLKTDIKASRRSVLFLINEELKNRGFIVTNYSLIEGIINAQRPMKLSTFREIFVNMDSQIDHKVIYTINVQKIDHSNTKVTLNISATYKEGGEYRKVKIGEDSRIVNEAKEILKEVKSQIG